MDFRYRELLRDYLFGDLAAGHQAAIYAFRSGFSLAEMRDSSLPWNIVKQYIYLLNPAILSPREVKDYKLEVFRQDISIFSLMEIGDTLRKLPQIDFFVKGHPKDNWYPSWPNNMIQMYIGFSKPESAAYQKEKWGRNVRISLFGFDHSSSLHRKITKSYETCLTGVN